MRPSPDRSMRTMSDPRTSTSVPRRDVGDRYLDFLAVILLLPRGVVPTLTELVSRRRARSSEPPASPGAGPASEPALPGGRVAGVAR